MTWGESSLPAPDGPLLVADDDADLLAAGDFAAASAAARDVAKSCRACHDAYRP